MNDVLFKKKNIHICFAESFSFFFLRFLQCLLIWLALSHFQHYTCWQDLDYFLFRLEFLDFYLPDFNFCHVLYPLSQGLRQNQILRFHLHLFYKSPRLELDLVCHCTRITYFHSYGLPIVQQRGQNDQRTASSSKLILTKEN